MSMYNSKLGLIKKKKTLVEYYCFNALSKDNLIF